MSLRVERVTTAVVAVTSRRQLTRDEMSVRLLADVSASGGAVNVSGVSCEMQQHQTILAYDDLLANVFFPKRVEPGTTETFEKRATIVVAPGTTLPDLTLTCRLEGADTSGTQVTGSASVVISPQQFARTDGQCVQTDTEACLNGFEVTVLMDEAGRFYVGRVMHPTAPNRVSFSNEDDRREEVTFTINPCPNAGSRPNAQVRIDKPSPRNLRFGMRHVRSGTFFDNVLPPGCGQ